MRCCGQQEERRECMKKEAKMADALLDIVAVAAVLGFLIGFFARQIGTFVMASPNVLALRIALIAAGSMIVAVSSIIGIVARLKHGKRAPDGESDHVALRGFAVAMLSVMVLCLTSRGVFDASEFECAALLCLCIFGSAVAARNRRWGWIAVYLLIFLFAGSILPAA